MGVISSNSVQHVSGTSPKDINITIGASGSNRRVIIYAIAQDTNPSTHTAVFDPTGINATMTPIIGSPWNGSGPPQKDYRIWAWEILEADLPVSAGTYVGRVSWALLDNKISLVSYYMEDMDQGILEDISAAQTNTSVTHVNTVTALASSTVLDGGVNDSNTTTPDADTGQTVEMAYVDGEGFYSSHAIGETTMGWSDPISTVRDWLSVVLVLEAAAAGPTIINRSLSDDAPVYDIEAARKAERNRLLVDSVVVSDLALSMSLVNRLIADYSGDITDSSLFNIIVGRNLQDNVSVSDSISVSELIGRSITENINVFDAVSLSLLIGRKLEDELSVYDFVTSSITPISIISRTLSDSIDVYDLDLAGSIFKFLSLAESVTVEDGLSSSITSPSGTIITRLLAEVIETTDGFSKSIFTPGGAVVSRLLEEAISTYDSSSRTLNATRTIADLSSVYDSIIVNQYLVRSLQDEVGVYDFLNVVMANVIARLLEDSVSVSDGLTKELLLVRLLASNIDVHDASRKLQQLTRVLEEYVETSETSTVTIDLFIKAYVRIMYGIHADSVSMGINQSDIDMGIS